MAVGLDSIYVARPSSAMDLIFKHRRSLFANRKSELVALMAISTTLFLFLHTRDLHSKLKEMEVRLQPDVSLSGHQLSGVLLTPTDVLTTCECLSEVKGYDQRHPSGQTEEQNGMRIMSPSILRIRTLVLTGEPYEYVNVTDVGIHPHCDGWGAYDYAMARLKNSVNISFNSAENHFPFSRTVKGNLGQDAKEPECYLSTRIKERRKIRDVTKKYQYVDVTMAPVLIADTEECREFMGFDALYVRYDWENKICVEASNMLPICKGDLGVPLICNETLVGIATANTAFCDWNSSLNMISSLEGAWDFIEGFVKTDGVSSWKIKAQQVLKSIKALID